MELELVMSRRTKLTDIPAPDLPKTSAALPAIGSDADPIFALIEAHRVASQVYADYEWGSDHDENYNEALLDDAMDALVRLLREDPTTLPGVAALLEHLEAPTVQYNGKESLLEYSLELNDCDHEHEIPNLARGILTRLAAVVQKLQIGRPALGKAAPSLDAELIALAGEIEALFLRHYELRETLRPVWIEGTKRRKRIARDLGGRKGFLQKWGEEGDDTFCDRMMAIDDDVAREFGLVEAAKEYERWHDVLQPLRERMLALPARTVAGIAAKALVAAYELDGLWAHEFTDLVLSDQLNRHMIETSLNAAGQSVPAVVRNGEMPEDRNGDPRANDEWIFHDPDPTAGIH